MHNGPDPAKAERFAELLRRLGAAPAASSFTEAFRQFGDILNAVVVELVQVDLLWCAIRDSADEPGLGRERRLDAIVLCQSEVHQACLEVTRAVVVRGGADQNVRRLDVAVHDAVPVNVVEGVRELEQRVEAFPKRPARDAGDRLSREELHREEWPAAELAVVIDAEAVGVSQRRERSELALESTASGPGDGPFQRKNSVSEHISTPS
jgi:hypothetical protein